ncbi:MAG: NTP transferase domain-containing protein [Planctomycetota bacterium]
MHDPSLHAHSDAAPRDPRLAAVILAAGKGTRMNSDLPKVVHEVAGRPMLWWVVDAVRRAGAARIVIVVGHEADRVRAVHAGDDADLRYVVQAEQLGTGHATACAEAALADFDGDVLVLAGDGPLIRPETIATMLERHRATGAVGTLATAIIDDPAGYGRVVRDADGRFHAIVEERDADETQRRIREVYPSYAVFDRDALFAELHGLEPNDASGEYYVTDVPARLRDAGRRVEVVEAVPSEDVLSINTPRQLAEVGAILAARHAATATEAER